MLELPKNVQRLLDDYGQLVQSAVSVACDVSPQTVALPIISGDGPVDDSEGVLPYQVKTYGSYVGGGAFYVESQIVLIHPLTVIRMASEQAQFLVESGLIAISLSPEEAGVAALYYMAEQAIIQAALMATFSYNGELPVETYKAVYSKFQELQLSYHDV